MVNYPLVVYHFQIEWGGANLGFTEVSGLNREVDVIEYKDGLSKEHSTIKMPGIVKNNNITFKRGVFSHDNEFYEWWSKNVMNTTERRDITISLMNEAHDPVVVWKAKNAFACKLNSVNMKADGNDVAIEELEICHEGLTIENS